ncbi:hypothetical protein [Dokdonia sp.]|uniref:hypothetical protein n=1 Tax=Dokdonia sp. TaxID=2024995 RepID=UPI003262ECC4
MNRILILIISLFTSLIYGQSFEGKLTYKIEFEINMEGISENDMINHMKKSGEYFDTLVINIKKGNYEKLVNSANSKRIVYRPDSNKIYNFDSGFEYVLITNAKKYGATIIDFEKPKIIQNDSIVSILGKKCNSITFSWGNLGEETYFYNDSFLKINPELFQEHNFEYLNEVLNLTKSYPTQIIKSLNDFIKIKMILVDYSEEKIDDSSFEIPELQLADKEYSELIKQTTGQEVMQLKN